MQNLQQLLKHLYKLIPSFNSFLNEWWWWKLLEKGKKTDLSGRVLEVLVPLASATKMVWLCYCVEVPGKSYHPPPVFQEKKSVWLTDLFYKSWIFGKRPKKLLLRSLSEDCHLQTYLAVSLQYLQVTGLHFCKTCDTTVASGRKSLFVKHKIGRQPTWQRLQKQTRQEKPNTLETRFELCRHLNTDRNNPRCDD